CVRCIHVSLSLSFVLYSSTTRRAFPSFPTRRSSDLSPEAWWPFQVGIGGSPLHDQRMRDFCREQYKSKHPSVRSLKKLKKTRSRDRKSTRLNSSHVSISYAVFCLKKKTRIKEQANSI